jgi:enolase-phosphatase E1
VRANASVKEVRDQLTEAAKLCGVAENDHEAILSALQQWIVEDKKVTPLKALQGMLWEHGYRNGDYRAHIYIDAYEKLKQWHAEGLKLYIYSSGSIQAQKLFFGFSEYGDMLSLFSDFFDTTSGPKQHEESYRTIIGAIGLPAEEILFLSDIVQELDAAKAAGLQTCWIVRPADTTADAAAIQKAVHGCASDFSGIDIN